MTSETKETLQPVSALVLFPALESQQPSQGKDVVINS